MVRYWLIEEHGPRHEEEEDNDTKKKKTTEEALDVHLDPQEWRDWANILPELVGEISRAALAVDVADYHRLRAVCRPWRRLTADPRRPPLLDPRFRPRNWAALSITPDNPNDPFGDLSPRRPVRILNLATGTSLGVDIPAAFPFHCHICAAEGLLVLLHRPTLTIRLVDPLTNVVTDSPPISAIAVAPTHQPIVLKMPEIINCWRINGACFDDSTSPPTLVLCLRGPASNIVVAKPGNDRQPAPRVRAGEMPPHNPHLLLPGPRQIQRKTPPRLMLPEEHRPRRSALPTTTGGRLLPLRSIGRHAVFFGHTHSILVSTETFPSLAADAVYSQRAAKFSRYRLDDGTTAPVHNFRLKDYQWFAPCARPCNLDQYLVCYVDR